MSIENTSPHMEQNVDSNSNDNNIETSTFDSRVEPVNANPTRNADSLPMRDDSVQSRINDFDSRVESNPVDNASYINNDYDFDHRIQPGEIMDTPFPGYHDELRDDLQSDWSELTPAYTPHNLHVNEDPMLLTNADVNDSATESEIPTGVVEYVHTRNESLENDQHPITGVKFVKKVVERPDGSKVEGVFPEFDSEFTAQLPDDMLTETDTNQFCECNKQLLDAIENDPEIKAKFTPEQIEQIKDGVNDGTAPDGYVWHHNEESGKMELVDADVHAKTGHTGGRYIWGGGTENR